MNLLAACCGISDLIFCPSLGWEGIKGRVKYPQYITVTLT